MVSPIFAPIFMIAAMVNIAMPLIGEPHWWDGFYFLIGLVDIAIALLIDRSHRRCRS